jgi:hypothetical protein
MRRTTFGPLAAYAILCGSVVIPLLPARALAETMISTCGQLVPSGDTGILIADLVCPTSDPGVSVGKRAELELDGHTITGGWTRVNCPDGACRVTGPGVLSGGGSGIGINSSGSIFASDVTAQDNAVGLYGVRMRLQNVTATANTSHGINAFGGVSGSDVTVTDNGDTGLSLDFRGNVVITRLVATGNGWAGVICDFGRVKLTDSTVTGNEFPDEFEPPLLDLFSAKRPKLTNTTCDHSLGPDGSTWGVCTGD